MAIFAFFTEIWPQNIETFNTLKQQTKAPAKSKIYIFTFFDLVTSADTLTSNEVTKCLEGT